MKSKGAKRVKKQLKKLIEGFNEHIDPSWRYIRYVSICIILDDGSAQRVYFPIVRKPSRSAFYQYGFGSVPFQIKDKLYVNTGYAKMVDFLKMIRYGHIVSTASGDVLTYIISKKEINPVFGCVFEVNGKFYQIDHISVMEDIENDMEDNDGGDL